jgi:hypothetical protein
VVAVDEQRDRRERRDDPEERGPVAEQAATDVRPDPVDAVERDRAEDEHLDDDDGRHRLEERRPRDPGDRRLQERPDVADLRGREDALAGEPARRRVDDLVSALEPDPAVVLDVEAERDRRRDLSDDERAEHPAGPLQQPVDRAPARAGRAERPTS